MIFSGKLDPAQVKQADVVLLRHPLSLQYPDATRRNDLLFYERMTTQDGPAMTWSMFSIGWLDVGDEMKAAKLFGKSYLPYVQEPFKIWTEDQGGHGAVNFQTGMGGFLQVFLYGYGSLRIRHDRLDFISPRLPFNVTELHFKSVRYIDAIFDYIVQHNMVIIDVIHPGSSMVLQYRGHNIQLEAKKYSLPKTGFSIYHDSLHNCPAPPTHLPIKYRQNHIKKLKLKSENFILDVLYRLLDMITKYAKLYV